MNLLMRNISALVTIGLLGAIVFLSGCATVKSTQLDAKEIGEGVTYYLPKRDVKITIERTLLTQDELKKGLAKQQEALKDIATELEAAKKALAIGKDRAKAPSVLANPKAKEGVEADLALAAADVAIAEPKKKEIEQEITRLEEGLRASERTTDGKCLYKYSAKLELLPLTADITNRLVANVAHNLFRDDTLKLVVTADGLLSSANAVADDKTGSIIVELASAFASGGGTSQINTFAATGKGFRAAPLDCERILNRFVYGFDPTVQGKNSDVSYKMQNADYPFLITVDEEDKTAPEDLIAKLNGLNSKNKGALFYRSAHPYRLLLKQCKIPPTCGEADSVPVDAVTVMLPQAGPVSYLPMNSRAFVKTVDDVVFENGMLKSWDATRPSEVLEIVRLPVSILKAVVSVPAEIVKLRVDLSDQQKGLAASQQAQLSAQAKLRSIQACVEAVGEDKDAALACFP